MAEYYSKEAIVEFIRSYRHSTDVAFHMEEHLYEIPAADVVCGESYRDLAEQVNTLADKLIKIREIVGCRNE